MTFKIFTYATDFLLQHSITYLAILEFYIHSVWSCSVVVRLKLLFLKMKMHSFNMCYCLKIISLLCFFCANIKTINLIWWLDWLVLQSHIYPQLFAGQKDIACSILLPEDIVWFCWDIETLAGDAGCLMSVCGAGNYPECQRREVWLGGHGGVFLLLTSDIWRKQELHRPTHCLGKLLCQGIAFAFHFIES